MPEILFPIGRMIGGSLEKLSPRTEKDGKTPKLDRENKPMMTCNFGVAIPKTKAVWWEEAWGAQMFETGRTAFPDLFNSPSFAWKIVDGDDTRPNQNGKVPATLTGYKGNWVLWFSQGWLPVLCSADGQVTLQPGAIVPGQYVQVKASVEGNGVRPPQTPGLYLNPQAVALAGDGPRIATADIDTTKVGFGGALPPGATPLAPAAVGFPAAAPTAALGFPAAAPTAAPGFPAAAPAPSMPVTPNSSFMAPPGTPAFPGAPAAPGFPSAPAAPVRTMTPAAGGVPYESWIAQGWTDDLLRAHGKMV